MKGREGTASGERASGALGSKRTLPVASPGPRRLPLLDARPVDRAARPIYAVWEITLRCDLACHHCGSRAGKPRANELTTAEALDLVDQLSALGVREVTLIGGEAYLRPDWTDIIARVRERGMLCSMTTGGRGVDAEVARAAARAGLVSASVSLDGLAPAHDEVRGLRGSFASAIGAMRNLRAAGVRVSVNTQLHSANVRELPALLDTIVANGALAWQIALTVPMGRAADRPELLLQPYDLLELFPILADCVERALRAGVVVMRGNNVGYFGPYEELFQTFDVVDHACGCGAGREILGIEADGTIKGCPSLATDRWSGGTGRDAPLVELWERGAALQRLRAPREAALSGFCRTCYYAAECGGGCTWTADALFGQPGNNPYCHHRALELAARGLRERVVRVEAPPGEPFDHGRFELVTEPLGEPGAR
ncbi:MAG: radical SAM protein [Polyangiaceae bacterium]